VWVEAFESILSALAAVLRKSRELEHLLARLRRAGRSSEWVDPKQLALLFEQMLEEVGPGAAYPAAVGEAEALTTPRSKRRSSRKRIGAVCGLRASRIDAGAPGGRAPGTPRRGGAGGTELPPMRSGAAEDRGRRQPRS
jgi:hypothetical protein